MNSALSGPQMMQPVNFANPRFWRVPLLLLALFPAEPFVYSATIDWGRLGEASLFHGRASVGVLIDNVELFTGYDYLKVGDVAIDGVIAGIRIWF